MKRLFVVIMVLVVLLCTTSISYAQDRDLIEARKCAKILQDFVTYVKFGGGSAGAKQYFNLPLTDVLGTNIPPDKFIDIMRTLVRQGYDFIGFDVFDTNIIRITLSNPKTYNEGRNRGKRTYTFVRVWFKQNGSGQWKISGLWRIWDDEYLEESQYR